MGPGFEAGIEGLLGGVSMRSERDKMRAGELYDPLDPELVRARDRARDLCQELNATREKDQEARRRILTALLGKGGQSAWMQRWQRRLDNAMRVAYPSGWDRD